MDRDAYLRRLDDAFMACACGSAIFFCTCGLQLVLLLLPPLLFTREPPLAPQPRPTQHQSLAGQPSGEFASPASANATTAVVGRVQPSELLYRDVEAEPQLFERIAKARSVDRELVLLTSDRQHLPMTLNLLAQLHELGITHHLLLARDAGTVSYTHLTLPTICSV